MTPEQAGEFHEDDEDPAEVFAWFDAYRPDGVTADPFVTAPDGPGCWICTVPGRFQHGPAYWLVRWHLRRMARD